MLNHVNHEEQEALESELSAQFYLEDSPGRDLAACWNEYVLWCGDSEHAAETLCHKMLRYDDSRPEGQDGESDVRWDEGCWSLVGLPQPMIRVVASQLVAAWRKCAVMTDADDTSFVQHVPNQPVAPHQGDIVDWAELFALVERILRHSGNQRLLVYYDRFSPFVCDGGMDSPHRRGAAAFEALLYFAPSSRSVRLALMHILAPLNQPTNNIVEDLAPRKGAGVLAQCRSRHRVPLLVSEVSATMAASSSSVLLKSLLDTMCSGIMDTSNDEFPMCLIYYVVECASWPASSQVPAAATRFLWSMMQRTPDSEELSFWVLSRTARQLERHPASLAALWEYDHLTPPQAAVQFATACVTSLTTLLLTSSHAERDQIFLLAKRLRRSSSTMIAAAQEFDILRLETAGSVDAEEKALKHRSVLLHAVADQLEVMELLVMRRLRDHCAESFKRLFQQWIHFTSTDAVQSSVDYILTSRRLSPSMLSKPSTPPFASTPTMAEPLGHFPEDDAPSCCAPLPVLHLADLSTVGRCWKEHRDEDAVLDCRGTFAVLVVEGGLLAMISSFARQISESVAFDLDDEGNGTNAAMVERCLMFTEMTRLIVFSCLVCPGALRGLHVDALLEMLECSMQCTQTATSPPDVHNLPVLGAFAEYCASSLLTLFKWSTVIVERRDGSVSQEEESGEDWDDDQCNGSEVDGRQASSLLNTEHIVRLVYLYQKANVKQHAGQLRQFGRTMHHLFTAMFNDREVCVKIAAPLMSGTPLSPRMPTNRRQLPQPTPRLQQFLSEDLMQSPSLVIIEFLYYHMESVIQSMMFTLARGNDSMLLNHVISSITTIAASGEGLVAAHLSNERRLFKFINHLLSAADGEWGKNVLGVLMASLWASDTPTVVVQLVTRIVKDDHTLATDDVAASTLAIIDNGLESLEWIARGAFLEVDEGRIAIDENMARRRAFMLSLETFLSVHHSNLGRMIAASTMVSVILPEVPGGEASAPAVPITPAPSPGAIHGPHFSAMAPMPSLCLVSPHSLSKRRNRALGAVRSLCSLQTIAANDRGMTSNISGISATVAKWCVATVMKIVEHVVVFSFPSVRAPVGSAGDLLRPPPAAHCSPVDSVVLKDLPSVIAELRHLVTVSSAEEAMDGTTSVLWCDAPSSQCTEILFNLFAMCVQAEGLPSPANKDGRTVAAALQHECQVLLQGYCRGNPSAAVLRDMMECMAKLQTWDIPEHLVSRERWRTARLDLVAALVKALKLNSDETQTEPMHFITFSHSAATSHGITRSSPQPFPSSEGFAFSLWVRPSPPPDDSTDNHGTMVLLSLEHELSTRTQKNSDAVLGKSMEVILQHEDGGPAHRASANDSLAERDSITTGCRVFIRCPDLKFAIGFQHGGKLPYGVWRHVCLSGEYDMTLKQCKISLYVNGVFCECVALTPPKFRPGILRIGSGHEEALSGCQATCVPERRALYRGDMGPVVVWRSHLPPNDVLFLSRHPNADVNVDAAKHCDVWCFQNRRAVCQLFAGRAGVEWNWSTERECGKEAVRIGAEALTLPQQPNPRCAVLPPFSFAVLKSSHGRIAKSRRVSNLKTVAGTCVGVGWVNSDHVPLREVHRNSTVVSLEALGGVLSVVCPLWLCLSPYHTAPYHSNGENRDCLSAFGSEDDMRKTPQGAHQGHPVRMPLPLHRMLLNVCQASEADAPSCYADPSHLLRVGEAVADLLSLTFCVMLRTSQVQDSVAALEFLSMFLPSIPAFITARVARPIVDTLEALRQQTSSLAEDGSSLANEKIFDGIVGLVTDFKLWCACDVTRSAAQLPTPPSGGQQSHSLCATFVDVLRCSDAVLASISSRHLHVMVPQLLDTCKGALRWGTAPRQLRKARLTLLDTVSLLIPSSMTEAQAMVVAESYTALLRDSITQSTAVAGRSIQREASVDSYATITDVPSSLAFVHEAVMALLAALVRWEAVAASNTLLPQAMVTAKAIPLLASALSCSKRCVAIQKAVILCLGLLVKHCSRKFEHAHVIREFIGDIGAESWNGKDQQELEASTLAPLMRTIVSCLDGQPVTGGLIVAVWESMLLPSSTLSLRTVRPSNDPADMFPSALATPSSVKACLPCAFPLMIELLASQLGSEASMSSGNVIRETLSFLKVVASQSLGMAEMALSGATVCSLSRILKRYPSDAAIGVFGASLGVVLSRSERTNWMVLWQCLYALRHCDGDGGRGEVDDEPPPSTGDSATSTKAPSTSASANELICDFHSTLGCAADVICEAAATMRGSIFSTPPLLSQSVLTPAQLRGIAVRMLPLVAAMEDCALQYLRDEIAVETREADSVLKGVVEVLELLCHNKEVTSIAFRMNVLADALPSIGDFESFSLGSETFFDRPVRSSISNLLQCCLVLLQEHPRQGVAEPSCSPLLSTILMWCKQLFLMEHQLECSFERSFFAPCALRVPPCTAAVLLEIMGIISRGSCFAAVEGFSSDDLSMCCRMVHHTLQLYHEALNSLVADGFRQREQNLTLDWVTRRRCDVSLFFYTIGRSESWQRLCTDIFDRFLLPAALPSTAGEEWTEPRQPNTPGFLHVPQKSQFDAHQSTITMSPQRDKQTTQLQGGAPLQHSMSLGSMLNTHRLRRIHLEHHFYARVGSLLQKQRRVDLMLWGLHGQQTVRAASSAILQPVVPLSSADDSSQQDQPGRTTPPIEIGRNTPPIQSLTSENSCSPDVAALARGMWGRNGYCRDRLQADELGARITQRIIDTSGPWVHWTRAETECSPRIFWKRRIRLLQEQREENYSPWVHELETCDDTELFPQATECISARPTPRCAPAASAPLLGAAAAIAHPQGEVACEYIVGLVAWASTLHVETLSCGGTIHLDIGGSPLASVDGSYCSVPVRLGHAVPPSMVWRFSDLRDCIPFRRYKMRRTAMVLRFCSLEPVLLNFSDEETCREVASIILSQILDGAVSGRPQDFVVPSQSRWNIPLTESAKDDELRRLTDEWVSGRMNNFDYLLRINWLAGRSTSDLSQYPVFPWVLVDCTSRTIDLSEATLCGGSSQKILRDLRWPIGAQTEKQRGLLHTRYAELCDLYQRQRSQHACEAEPSEDDDACDAPQTAVEPYHHGTLYSSPSSVLHFLVRLEPYASMHRLLHDGRYDHPDRLFNSVARAVGHGVFEALPEMFYLPAMFSTDKKIGGGSAAREDGFVIRDVELPPWASDGYQFVAAMRRVLECQAVTDNLPAWLDLIFGVKQSGDAAIGPLNTYHPMLNEAWVAANLSPVRSSSDRCYCDPLENQEESVAVLARGMWENMGQLPIRLFSSPHPSRSVDNSPKTFASVSTTYTLRPIRGANAACDVITRASRSWRRQATDSPVKSFVCFDSGRMFCLGATGHVACTYWRALPPTDLEVRWLGPFSVNAVPLCLAQDPHRNESLFVFYTSKLRPSSLYTCFVANPMELDDLADSLAGSACLDVSFEDLSPDTSSCLVNGFCSPLHPLAGRGNYCYSEGVLLLTQENGGSHLWRYGGELSPTCGPSLIGKVYGHCSAVEVCEISLDCGTVVSASRQGESSEGHVWHIEVHSIASLRSMAALNVTSSFAPSLMVLCNPYMMLLMVSSERCACYSLGDNGAEILWSHSNAVRTRASMVHLFDQTIAVSTATSTYLFDEWHRAEAQIFAACRGGGISGSNSASFQVGVRSSALSSSRSAGRKESARQASVAAGGSAPLVRTQCSPEPWVVASVAMLDQRRPLVGGPLGKGGLVLPRGVVLSLSDGSFLSYA